MKRLLNPRSIQLLAALVLLVTLAAGYAKVFQFRPRATIQLGYHPEEHEISPDGSLLATCPEASYLITRNEHDRFGQDEFPLEVWDTKSGARRYQLGADFKYHYGAWFRPDGKILAVGTRESGRLEYHAASGERCRESEPPPREAEERWFLGFTPDGRFHIYGDWPGSEIKQGPRHGHFIFSDIATKEVFRIDGVERCLRFLPDGKRFSVLEGGKVSLWNIPDDSGPQLLLEREFRGRQDAVSPDGTTFVALDPLSDSTGEYRVRLCDLATGEEKASVIYRDVGAVLSSVRFTPNGRFVVGYCRRLQGPGEDVLWDVSTGLRDARIFPISVRMSPGDRWVLRLDSTSAEFWDTSVWRKHVTLTRPGDQLDKRGPFASGQTAYRFSRDGRILVVTRFDVSAKISLADAIFTGRLRQVNTTETYPAVRLWDVERGEELATLRDCLDAWLSPDGRTLVTVDGNNVVRIWDVPPPRYYGLILALTTLTWSVVLLACWWVTRRYHRRALPSGGTPLSSCATDVENSAAGTAGETRKA
jgi:WD40 repeat protein